MPATAKIVAQEWKKLSSDERKVWEETARRDRERFELQKSLFKGPWKVEAQAKTPRDPTAPKKPSSAYLSFANSKRASVKKLNPSATNAEISRRLSQMWKAAPTNVRAVYVDKEAALRKKYKVDLAAWKAKMEAQQEAEWTEALANQRATGRGNERMDERMDEHRQRKVRNDSGGTRNRGGTQFNGVNPDTKNLYSRPSSFGGDSHGDAPTSGDIPREDVWKPTTTPQAQMDDMFIEMPTPAPDGSGHQFGGGVGRDGYGLLPPSGADFIHGSSSSLSSTTPRTTMTRTASAPYDQKDPFDNTPSTNRYTSFGFFSADESDRYKEVSSGAPSPVASTSMPSSLARPALRYQNPSLYDVMHGAITPSNDPPAVSSVDPVLRMRPVMDETAMHTDMRRSRFGSSSSNNNNNNNNDDDDETIGLASDRSPAGRAFFDDNLSDHEGLITSETQDEDEPDEALFGFDESIFDY